MVFGKCSMNASPPALISMLMLSTPRPPQRVRQRITFLFIYLHFWVVLRFYSHFWVMSRSMLFPPCKQPAPACTSFQHPPLKRNFFENSVFSVPSVFASQTNLQSCPHRASWHIFSLLLQPLDLSYHHLLILNFLKNRLARFFFGFVFQNCNDSQVSWWNIVFL